MLSFAVKAFIILSYQGGQYSRNSLAPLFRLRAVAVAVDFPSTMGTQRQGGDSQGWFGAVLAQGHPSGQAGAHSGHEGQNCLALGTSVVMGFFKSDGAGAQLEELSYRINVF